MGEIKGFWRFLMHHKAILFASLAVLAVLIYLWWHNQQSGTAPLASSTGGVTLDGGNTVPADTGQGSGVPGVVVPNTSVTGSPVVQNSTTGQVQPTLTPNWFSIIPVPFVSPAPGNTPSPASPTSSSKTYLVVTGDTLASVAKKLHLTPNELYNDNRAVISLVSSRHGGPYWDTGKPTKSPPAGVKLYAGTILSY
jgi:hypothetical protein